MKAPVSLIDRDKVCVVCWHDIHPDKVCGAEDWTPSEDGVVVGRCFCDESVSANQRGGKKISLSYNG